ncbi:MAG: adenylate/guanylate cyclase domain-containing protein [Paracoccaceae bacterium]
MADACVLMADITGSTPLYEKMSQTDALAQISKILDRMRAIIAHCGGHCIKSQGDDTLSVFRTSRDGFRAAQMMIQDEWDHGLSLHAGLYFGEVLRHENDIYGNAVNTAARLATMAKPGELLIGDEAFDALTALERSSFVPMGDITLKGKQGPTRIYSFTNMFEETQEQTVVFNATRAKPVRAERTARLQHGDRTWTLAEGQSLTIGRSDDNDIALPLAWVSRRHGKVELRGSQMEFTDHSSTGSFVLTAEGEEIEVHRRATLLNGEGTLVFGTPDHTDERSILRFSTRD